MVVIMCMCFTDYICQLNPVVGVLYVGARWRFLLSNIFHNSELFCATWLVKDACLADDRSLLCPAWHWVISPLLSFLIMCQMHYYVNLFHAVDASKDEHHLYGNCFTV